METGPNTKPSRQENNVEDVARAEYKKKVEILDEKIKALTEEIERIKNEGNEDGTGKTKTQTTPEVTNRRDFLKKAALFTAGAGIVAISQKIGLDDKPETIKEKAPESTPPKEIPKEEIEGVKDEAKECRKIIEQGEYEKILEHPYLVSALYYSKQAIEKMLPPYKSPNEEIIANIYPAITRQFRENYIKYLKKSIAEKSTKTQIKKLKTRSKLLKILGFGKNLEKNHKDAIDLFIKEGSPIHTMSGGLVVLAENGWDKNNNSSTSSNKGGNTVIIFNPEDESFYRYAHMRETKTKTNLIIESGKEIGTVGDTGENASKKGHGGHLHFEINKYDRESGTMIPLDVFELKRKIQASINY